LKQTEAINLLGKAIRKKLDITTTDVDPEFGCLGDTFRLKYLKKSESGFQITRMKVIFGHSNIMFDYFVDLRVGWDESKNCEDESVPVRMTIRDKNLTHIYTFESKDISACNQSLSDNRKVTFKMKQFAEFFLVFNSVFKKH
jgi:hypothetical protein